MDLQQEKERGLAAKNIINSSLWQEAIESLNTSLLAKMAKHYNDPKACQEIALTRVVADNFLSWFEELAQTGELAEIQLAREAELEERNQKLRKIPGAL